MNTNNLADRIVGNYLKATVSEWTKRDLGYVEPKVKNSAHTKAKRLLTVFATSVLGLSEDQFEVTSNKGGVAVSGEVTLMTNSIDGGFGIMVQIGQWSCGNNLILYRAVNDCKDYHGYRNQLISMVDAFGSYEAIEKFGKTVRSLVSNPNQSRI